MLRRLTRETQFDWPQRIIHGVVMLETPTMREEVKRQEKLWGRSELPPSEECYIEVVD